MTVGSSRTCAPRWVGILRAAGRMGRGGDGCRSRPRAHRGHPYRGHAGPRARRLRQTPRRHPGHHARVAHPRAHQRSARDPPIGATGDRGRDPRLGGHEARCAPGGLAGAVGGTGRSAAPADRPVGDRPAGGGSGPLSRRVRRPWRPAAGGGGDAGHRKALDLTVAVPVDDMAKLGRSDEIPDGPAAGAERGGRPLARGSTRCSSNSSRAHRSTLLFVDESQLANGLAGRPQRPSGGRAGPGAPRLDCARGATPKSRTTWSPGRLALVATSSLELDGIDVGAVDLVTSG